MTLPILVTAATGNTGREVIDALRRRELPVVACTRTPEAELPADVERRTLDFRDPRTWSPALAGCKAVFLLRPPAITDVEKTLNPFIDAARAAGVEHIVFLSVAGADRHRFVPHHAVERHLEGSPGRYTILRPGFFAQNLQDAYLRDIREDDRLFVPAGRARVAFVDLYDVAEVAALVFADPAAHDGAGYTLTGARAVSFDEVAAILTAALDRPVRYEAASVLGYVRHLRRRRGLGWGQAAVQTLLHVGLRFGQAETVDPTLERLLGRPGRSLSVYVEGNTHLWHPSGLPASDQP